ncbi:protease-associated domain-containing protein 1 isoform X1 [Rhipicephalus sanguineus]|uniref:protease-associated domain-containing protein 1 isoform X1 n=1 Tax=Rhipicephalus sanguineus TaxID=34632 RepID=UPI001894397D|nr:protease-associated domain-containing protein 1 isoform X1 [Rhipicephalus sanguineus]
MRRRLLRSTASLLLTYCCFLVDVLANLVSSDGLKEDIFFEILEPESLRYTFRLRPAHEFGSSFATQLSNVGLVLSEPLQGCASLVNRLELRHNVVLVERGGCSFLTKCVEVRRQGALAVIVADSDPSNDDQYVDMMDDSTRRNCSIPAAFLLGKDGYMIRRGLEAHGLRRALINIPVNVSGVPAHRLRQPPWLVW